MSTLFLSLGIAMFLVALIVYAVKKETELQTKHDKHTIKMLMDLQKEDPEAYFDLVKHMNREQY